MRRFKQLVNQHKDRIYSFSFYFLGDAADAEDVTQEVLIRLWEHYRKLDNDRLTGWILRVTRNACVDAYRKRQTYKRVVDVDSDGLDFQHATTAQPSPESDLESAEFQQQLHAALSQIPEPHRSIVILREIQDQKYEQISEMLDLPLNTVKVYLHRGRRQLREALRKLIPHEIAASIEQSSR